LPPHLPMKRDGSQGTWPGACWLGNVYSCSVCRLYSVLFEIVSTCEVLESQIMSPNFSSFRYLSPAKYLPTQGTTTPDQEHEPPICRKAFIVIPCQDFSALPLRWRLQTWFLKTRPVHRMFAAELPTVPPTAEKAGPDQNPSSREGPD
jgi:hypothetical protein